MTWRRLLPVAMAGALLLSSTPASASVVYREDFSTPGHWPASVQVYTGGHYHPTESLSVHDGVLDGWMFNRVNPAVPGGWESVTTAFVAAVNGHYVNLRYGEWQWRMMLQPDSGGLRGWSITGVLWPESNDPADGEIDFPEWHPGGPMMIFAHETGTHPKQNCQVFQIVPGPGPLGVWHDYGLRWSASGFSFWIDGQRYWSTTCGQPRGRMHLVLQTGFDNGLAPPDSFGHALFSWEQIVGAA